MPSLKYAAAAVLVAAGLTAGGSGAQLAAGSPASTTASTTASTSGTPVTPGPISGYGFDQCNAPNQAAMDAWRKHSPFRAVGIYMSGSLRFCHEQPNLTPTWVRTQLAAGWRLLPIHLGRQAGCSTRERYQGKLISANPAGGYATARAQGVDEAKIAVAAAKRLGIVRNSTLYYDLEAFSIATAACRNSALWFLGAWSNQIRASGYLSGVYSSAASGIKALDDARVDPDSKIPMPDQIWIAEWNGEKTVSSDYLRPDGWPGRRIHQYRGGHDETYGGVTINIDSNVLDLHGFPTCSAANVNRASYRLSTPDVRRDLVTPLQCTLKKNGFYPGTVTGAWNTATNTAVATFQDRVGHPTNGRLFSRADWVSLFARGTSSPTLARGSTGTEVLRAQRALNAAGSKALALTGRYDDRTFWATYSYQKAVGLPASGKLGRTTWRYLLAGRLD